MKIGIVGFGREGKMAVEYWKEKAETFFVYDKNEILNLPENCIARTGVDYKQKILADQKDLNLIVRSPGVPLWDIEENITAPITSITNEFFEKCPCKVIGITGTKGKGTTSSLIYEILKDAGRDVYLVGNIGVPALSVLEKLTKDSVVVYELSSFQLYDLKKSPQVAVCLLITEDHLDWHKDINHYQNAKESIFKFQKSDDTAIWYTQNQVSKSLAKLSGAENRIPFGEGGVVRVQDEKYLFQDEFICNTNEIALPGKHNEQNVCAAIAATYTIVPKENIINALRTFKGLPFHIEDKGVKNGIRFINDSFSVNPTSTVVAVDTFKENIILMLGGVDRGLHLEELQEKIFTTKNIKQVILYGKFGERLMGILTDLNFEDFVFINSKNFKEIFEKTVSLAQAGDVVLFSPGAPSFDLFENYIKRGEKFDKLVKSL